MQNVASVLDLAPSTVPISRREQLLTAVRVLVLAGSAAALIGAGALALHGFVGGGIVMMNTEREEARLQLGNALVSGAIGMGFLAFLSCVLAVLALLSRRHGGRLLLAAIVSLALTLATVAPVLHQNARLNCALRGSQVTSC
jgi:hypothetical protein